MNELNKPHFELGEIIGRSKIFMPDHNFEQLVMTRLKEEAELKKSRQYIGFSVVFFALFVALGYIVSTRLTVYLPPVSGLSPQRLKLIFQVMFVLSILFRAEYLIKYYRHNKLDIS
jgi:hypothetical protein